MVKGRAKKLRAQGSQRNVDRARKQNISEGDLSRVEFHRHALALLPHPADKRPGIAYFVESSPLGHTQRLCSCAISRDRTCTHILKLVEVYKTLKKSLKGGSLEEGFRSSIWYSLANVLADGSREKPLSVRIQSATYREKKLIKVIGSNGEEMLYYLSQGPDLSRFLERCGKSPGDAAAPHRGKVLRRLALLTLTENERFMMDRDFKTRRQTLEESFWYRAAYHGYREFGATGCSFHPAIEETTGSFTVACKDPSGDTAFRMVIPRNKVKRLLITLKEFLPNQHDLAIHPIPLKSIFKVAISTALDLEVRPVIQLIQESGEERFFEREDLERFRYGDLIYIKELGILAELEPPGRMERKFRAPVKMSLKKSQVPTFLDEFGDDLLEGPHLVDEEVKSLKIFKQVDRIEITPEALDRDWCWLSVKYGFGNTSVSLIEIMRAREEGQRYIGTDKGWVDCKSRDLDVLDSILDRSKGEKLSEESSAIKLSRMDLFHLIATRMKPVDITGDGDRTDLLKRMLELRPMRPLPEMKGMTSSLRPYQERGVEWIWFLFENGFGGLLCDDMGLGKTHEVMSFMVGLREHENVKGPFLVVCPTTVLSHWDNKIREHAPGLKPVLYHGGQRDLGKALKDNDVILTSYGILRWDIEKLKDISFSLAVFDEIQNIKNPQTLAYHSAEDIKARMKLGLTGTPIENSLGELKALFDLTMPGYFGTDKGFDSRYVKPIEFGLDTTRREELSRLISPFTLRRLKETVLDDLPEKIEDIRSCRLSEDQVKLYRDAISSRGKGLLQLLKDGEKPVPYIHIFALLNLLKQICNHPAMVEGTPDDYEQYQSGKWELFKELIAESLDSGQKVVVYSQFLGMIKIIEGFLQTQNVDFVTLTGASRKRGEIISRFNNNPDCRLYVGSLKAGGTGIDLVAASVVIHYDRWWNAAREDQATDRVHRIGQKRGVQVFKLVTEGTLEEKISAIIEKKRNLMDSIVKESDPGILRSFSRAELIELLSVPS